MLILYRISIALYGFLILLVSGFHGKAKGFRAGRKNWRGRLSQDIGDHPDPLIWMHAASLGEFEQGRPVMERIKRDRPHFKILLTFFSPSGHSIGKNHELVDWAHYLPLDTPRNARDFFQIVRPALVLFVKYEFWYFFLKGLSKNGIPTLVISALFRKDQFFFHWSGRFFRPVFQQIDHFFVQDRCSAGLISDINSHVTVAGDTRFDRVVEIAEHARSYSIVEDFLSDEKCFVMGSSWPSDMGVLHAFVETHINDFKFIIAPHQIKEDELARMESKWVKTSRYSSPRNLEDSRVLIIDNVGMLSSLYKYADFAFIGGGFRGALHNTLEAAVFGVPVFFGDHDHNQKFKEAVELLEAVAAFAIQGLDQLDLLVTDLLQNTDRYKKVCRNAKEYVYSKRGATDMIMRKVLLLI